MSDFTSGFWSWYVIVLTAGSIGYCAWVLWASGRVKVAAPSAGKEVGTTGHVWDGDLAEYNNPLPKWWSYLFWITIAFGVLYLIIYPGFGNFKGAVDWTSAGAYQKESAEAEAKFKPLYDKYAAMDLKQVAVDPAARAMGERMFLVNCAPCHGSAATGGPGFPNLTDKDWLYGGDPEVIQTSITGGRMGVMPAFGPTLGDAGVKNVAAYVRSLSGLPHDAVKAQQGKQSFDTICAACHGPDGKGNQAIGAPNLTDQIWLYGSAEKTIAEGVTNGRHLNLDAEHPPMPSFKDRLDPAKIHILAAYVWGLSNNAPAK
jgi:cytochrome c oxidase cbb3-type subunit 3